MHSFFIQKKYSADQGFTLVELMVSLMIFTIVVLAAVGSLYTVNNASRKVQAMRTVLDNVTFAIESMSRTIRTSNYVVCGGSSNTSGDSNCPFADQAPKDMLFVYNTLGTEGLIEYRLGQNTNGTGNIEKRAQEGCPGACIWSDWIALTAPEVDVQQLWFYVDGANASDGIQPSVALFISGVATTSEDTEPFATQTYISVRATE